MKLYTPWENYLERGYCSVANVVVSHFQFVTVFVCMIGVCRPFVAVIFYRVWLGELWRALQQNHIKLSSLLCTGLEMDASLSPYIIIVSATPHTI